MLMVTRAARERFAGREGVRFLPRSWATALSRGLALLGRAQQPAGAFVISPTGHSHEGARRHRSCLQRERLRFRSGPVPHVLKLHF